MTKIEDKTVLITGGASGIGRLVALKMAALGGKVVIWDIHRENLGRATDQIESATGRKAHGYLCDVSDRQAVYATAERVKNEVGPVEVLVNNAGIVSGKKLLECSDEQIERTMAVNSLALFWTTRAFLPEMIAAGRGHVVTMASAAGLIGVSGLADYSASKWAAVGFDEALRMELRQIAPGVKTTVVCPFFVNNELFRGVTTRFPWLLPILEEDDVAEQIVRAVRRNRRRLAMPWLVRLIPWMRTLPIPLMDAMANLLGLNRSMDHFVGRSADDGDVS